MSPIRRDTTRLRRNPGRFQSATPCSPGRRGPLRVRAELVGRGIAPELADEALAVVFTTEATDRALQRALDRLLRGAAVPEDLPDRERLARRLLRAGFPGAQVRRILNGPGGDDDPFNGSH